MKSSRRCSQCKISAPPRKKVALEGPGGEEEEEKKLAGSDAEGGRDEEDGAGEYLPFCYHCGCTVCGEKGAGSGQMMQCVACGGTAHAECAGEEVGARFYCSPVCLWGAVPAPNPSFNVALSAALQSELEDKLDREGIPRAYVPPPGAPLSDVTARWWELRREAIVAYFAREPPFYSPFVGGCTLTDEDYLLHLASPEGQAAVLSMLHPRTCAIGSKIVVPPPKLLQQLLSRSRSSTRAKEPWEVQTMRLAERWAQTKTATPTSQL